MGICSRGIVVYRNIEDYRDVPKTSPCVLFYVSFSGAVFISLILPQAYAGTPAVVLLPGLAPYQRDIHIELIPRHRIFRVAYFGNAEIPNAAGSKIPGHGVDYTP
jgi:hypothetical protein